MTSGSTLPRLALAAACAIGAVSCGMRDTPRTITETRAVPSHDAAPPASSAGLPEAGGSTAPTPHYAWETPSGWREIPSTDTRAINLQVGEAPGAECYLTELPGQAGGLLANVNRWRAQMGLEALDEAQLADLPTTELLGQRALLVEFAGTYTGMGGSENKPGYKLLGALLEQPEYVAFVKFIGPETVVNSERANFESFLKSIERHAPDRSASRLPEGHPDLDSFQIPAGQPLPEGHPAIGEVAGAPQLPPGHPEISSATAPMQMGSGLSWNAPATWTRMPDKVMRVVTYKMGSSGKSECYVTVLSGPAGGVEANLNRWREQMGQPPLKTEEIGALPRLTVLGREAPFIEVTGNFTGMDGQTLQSSALFGVVCALDDRALFVKMTGPRDEVLAEKENFIAFCESLR